MNGGYDGGLSIKRLARGAEQISQAEAMRLLSGVDHGRVVFTVAALPAIRPVNHLVDDGRVIIRTRFDSAVATAVRSPMVLAYEADSIDSRRRVGWSVVVTGSAFAVTDADQVERYERMLHPWINHADTVVAIDADIVTGFRIALPAQG